MFFSASDLQTSLKCAVCNNKLRDPRVVPCGKSICSECIIKSTEGDIFSGCACSQKEHLVPENGFILSETINLLLNLEPDEVFRSKKVQDFKDLLEKLRTETDHIKKDIKQGADTIIEHCRSIKNEIDIGTETIIEAIQNHRSELIRKVETYESECLDNLKNYKIVNNGHVKFLNEMNQFYDEWLNYLNQFKIDEDEIENAIKSCNRNLNRLQDKSLALIRANFFNKTVCFNPNKEFTKTVGCLEFKQININFLNPIEIFLGCGNYCSCFDYDILPGGNIFICWICRTEIITYSVFNTKKKYYEVLGTKLLANGSKFLFIKCCIIKKIIICYVQYNVISNINCQAFYIFNTDNFELNVKIMIDEEFLDIQANSNEIFCLSIAGSLKIFDSSMNCANDVKATIGLSQIGANIDQIKVNESNCFLFSNSTAIGLIYLKDMTLIKIDLIDLRSVLILNDFSIVHWDENKKLMSYHDLDGFKMFEETLNMSIDLSLVKVVKNDVLLYRKNQETLLVFNQNCRDE